MISAFFATGCAIMPLPDRPATPTVVVAIEDPRLSRPEGEEDELKRTDDALQPVAMSIPVEPPGTEYAFDCDVQDPWNGKRSGKIVVFEPWSDPVGGLEPFVIQDLDQLTSEAKRRFEAAHTEPRPLPGARKVDCELQGMTFIRIQPYWPDLQ
ncbi:MAG: hypothetical protein V1745_04730 [Patescibacteria group bacterium]